MSRHDSRAATLEIAAMTTLLLSYIWLWQGSFPGHFLVVCGLYAGIGAASHRRRGESAREIGLRLDNLRQATLLALGVVGPLVAGFLVLGALLETWHFPEAARIPGALLKGTVWGALQQYGLLAFYYRRFRELVPGSWTPMIAAAGMFALFHLPNPFLTPVTLLAGVLACWLYKRVPNILALGLAHALLSLAMGQSLPYEITFGHRVGPGFWRFVDRQQARVEAAATLAVDPDGLAVGSGPAELEPPVSPPGLGAEPHR